MLLTIIERWDTLVSLLRLLVDIIGTLICNQSVSNSCSPVMLWKRHGWPILERLVATTEDTINEVEAIVKHLVLCRIRNDVTCMKGMVKVVTDVDSEFHP